MNNEIIKISNISKTYCIDCEQNDVIESMNLSIADNEFICIVGYTGCGKSTLLRLIAGFEQVDSGDIFIDGKKHSNPTKDTMMIFQDYNQLFPWKTALGNIMYAVKRTGIFKNRKDAKSFAMNILDEVGLSNYYNYYPHQLSGGMKQRVAVGRAIAIRPKILLMDEPFAALDEVNRFKLQKLCRKIFVENGITIVFVTHSISEAVALADRIVVMGRCKGNILANISNDYIKTQKEDDSRLIREKILSILKQNIKNYE